MGGPLAGRRVLVTRAAEQAGELASRLRGMGAEVLLLPGIEVLPPATWESLDGALDALDRFDWIAFTSRNAIAPFFERLAARGKTLPARAKVAAVGGKTAAALAERGLTAPAVPAEHGAESLVRLLAPEIRGRRVLWPRAERAQEILAERLLAAGAAEVRGAVCYRVRTPEVDAAPIRRALAEGAIDAVTLGSPRTLEGVLELLGAEAAGRLARCRLVCVGPTTAAACRALGLAPVIAAPHTAEGIADAVRHLLAR